MWTDVVDLHDFYASPLGRTAQRVLRRDIRACWPDVRGQAVLGLGYATPYLSQFRAEADRVVAAMPAAQGVIRWPEQGAAATVLSGDHTLPFPDLSMDRVLLVHALDCTDVVRPLLREIWRVLSDSGRLLVIVPNRTGPWARLERTPFGHGRPFSPRQLTTLLRETMFTPIRSHTALFVPPVRRFRMLLSSAPAFEKIGKRWFSAVGGVVVSESAKTIYAANLAHATAKRQYVTVTD